LKFFSSLFKSNRLSSFSFYQLEAAGAGEYFFKAPFTNKLSKSD